MEGEGDRRKRERRRERKGRRGAEQLELSVTSLAAQARSGLKWFCDLVNYSLAQMLSASAENEDW